MRAQNDENKVLLHGGSGSGEFSKEACGVRGGVRDTLSAVLLCPHAEAASTVSLLL